MPTWSPAEIEQARRLRAASNLSEPDLDLDTACSTETYAAFQRHAEMLRSQTEIGCDVAGRVEFEREWEYLQIREKSRSEDLQIKCNAGRSCAPYLGKTVRPVSFDSVFKAISKIPKSKDEFETSDQFGQRQEVARNRLKPVYIVDKSLNTAAFRYDADRGILQMTSLVFDDKMGTYTWSLRDAAELDGVGDSGTFYGLVIGEQSIDTGTRVGTNAFGVSVLVDQIHQTNEVILDPDGHRGDHLVGRGSVIDEFQATPVEARKRKDTLQGAIVLAPKEPFYGTGATASTATLEHPVDIKEETDVIVADIQCALLLDEKGKVVRAYKTL
jgi:hypothetical protein